MSQNRSIRDFFKGAQANVKNAATSERPPQRSAMTMQTPTIPAAKQQTNSATTETSSGSIRRGYTSSLSPPPSDFGERSQSPLQSNAVGSKFTSHGISDREIKGSDDEEDNSDDDLPNIFQSTYRPSTQRENPATPTGPRTRRAQPPLASPLAIHPKKYKFNMESLVNEAAIDKKAEESSKRVKAMLEKKIDENVDLFAAERSGNLGEVNGSLLESVVANKEDGGMEKVTRAIRRTEATTVETQFYFFNTLDQQTELSRPEFPTTVLPQIWKKLLSKPVAREQTFISGFAEDMVHFGQALPDEIFLWILDEACLEPRDVFHTSYLNVAQQSTEQVKRLLTPDVVEKMLRNLGATPTATTVTEKIIPRSKLAEGKYIWDWTHIGSVISLFARISESLSQKTRIHLICMLLRMSADRIVIQNVDVLVLLQEGIRRLCRYIPPEDWEFSCQTICKCLFDSIEQPTLRLQVVEAISSVQPRPHELRRRLALCFFFNDILYATDHPHETFDLDKIMDHLEGPIFDFKKDTDYQQMSALVGLLDIAVDDGRNAFVDLSNPTVADRFDHDVDTLVQIVKDVMKSIGSVGTAYISRIETKEALDLVSERFADTLRSRPKPKKSVFDDALLKRYEDYSGEKAAMKSFVNKWKKPNIAEEAV